MRFSPASVRATLSLVVSTHALFAAYSNLRPSADGSSVVFRATTGFNGPTTYKLGFDQGQPVLKDAGPVEDISADGATVANASCAERFCGFAGSTCFLAAPCQASFSISGPGNAVASSTGRRSIVRLNRSGTEAWIEQSVSCAPIGIHPMDYEGLYALPQLSVLRARDGRLANYQASRRMITTRDQVLTFGGSLGIQLQLVDPAGVHPIHHIYGAEEAVIDADGGNVVYLDAPVGHLHWIDLAAQTEDALGQDVLAASPAISDDGKLLAFLTPAGEISLYRRATRTFESVNTGDSPVNEFAFTGNGQFIFAVTAHGRLIHIDLSNGTAQTWLEPFPEIQDASTLTSDRCPLICYPAPDRLLLADPTAIIVLRGTGLDQPGLRVQLGERDWPLLPLSTTAAWFQAPADLAATPQQTLTVFLAGNPLRFSSRLDGIPRVVTCFGALHQAFDSIVTGDNPARVGEAVHVFVTGLTGVEPIPVGMPNPLDRLIAIAGPPSLNSDGGFQPLFFGLAPGLIGLQQLDIRIQRPAAQGSLLFADDVQQFGCTVPAGAP